MKSTRETRKEQMAALQNKKGLGGKADNAARPQRAAFGDLTNAVKSNAADGKKGTGVAAKKGRQQMVVKAQPPKATAQVKTRKATAAAAAAATATKTTSQPEKVEQVEVEKPKAHDLSDMTVSDLELSFSDISVEERCHSRMSLDRSIQESTISNKVVMPEVPDYVEDIDSSDQDDINQVALYAQDVFTYYKQREELFRITPYMVRQPQVTQRMRAVLVDWMVEVQENFELNHETLYLAVKVVDAYLAVSQELQRDIVQLLGAVCLFLASKYDERMPPAIDDFIYICDHAYDRDQFMAMEREVFRAVGFDLGRPIPYRYLRRYAKCGRSETKTLYLARYLLELGLMEYKFVFQSESMLAASTLYVAKKMRQDGEWTPTLEYYTGYTLSQMKPLILEINKQFRNPRFPELHTIVDKYKHQVFLKVADIPPVSNDVLFFGVMEQEEEVMPDLH